MSDSTYRSRPWTFAMHLYNIVIILGYSAFVALHYLIPGLGELTGLTLDDPLLFSLTIPLFMVLAAHSYRSLAEPEGGYQQMKIQIAYKPFAIVLFWIFTISGAVPVFYSALITVGLLIYIGGNLRALREQVA